MKWPKVLVAQCVYEDKDYIFPRWMHQMKNLTYPNYDIMVVDNSKNKDYYRKLKRRGYRNIFHTDRGDNSREAVARSLNFIRKKVIEGGYDYWMSIETDLIPPVDIIQQLMKHWRPVVGSIYNIGYGTKEQPYRPCLFDLVPDGKGGVKTQNLPPEQGFSFVGKGLQQIHGCGLGCTLIERDILENKINGFYWVPQGGLKHPDVFFYKDLENRKIPVYVDGNQQIPHYNSKWDNVKDR